MNNEIIVLAGFSAAGKDTLARVLSAVGYNFVVFHSTRPMRPEEETQGNPYNFIDDNQMLSMMANEELIEIREYQATQKKWFYALHKDAIKEDKKYVVVMDLEGAQKLRVKFGERVRIINIFSKNADRLKRAQQRKDFNMEEWERRLSDDMTKYTQARISELSDATLINNDIISTSISLLRYIESIN